MKRRDSNTSKNHGEIARFFSPFDLMIILMIGMVTFVTMWFVSTGDLSRKVVVLVDGEVYAELPLDEDATLTIMKGDRYLSTLLVDGERGMARLIHSECPLKICEKTGWVGPGGRIVCVPNRIVVKVGRKKAQLDAITW